MENGHEFREQSSEYRTFLLSKEMWSQVKDQVIKLVGDCFPDIPPKIVEPMFTKTFAKDIIVLLNDEISDQLVGFTQAHIYTEDPTLANIGMSGVLTEKRGQGLIGKLMDKLEEELKNRGVQYVTREARITDGYADTIERHYGDRIIEKTDMVEGTVDPKRHFKIKL